MRKAGVGAVVFLVGIAAFQARAAVPELVNFQARLSDANGNAVADGDYQVAFTIYAAATGGTALWTEAQTVTVAKGVFSATLGSVTTLDLAFDAQYWLGIEVETDGEMTPRFKLASAPYALRAASAASADTADALGSVTETDVTTLQAGKADAAALNDGDDATTPVGWNDLANVPAGFADGVDNDAQVTETQVELYVTNGPVDLAAGTTLGGTVLSVDGHAHSSLSGPGGSPADALVVDGAGNVNVDGKVREYGNDLLPRGVIVMWSGTLAAIPSGWALCDGGTYTAPDSSSVTTPDLRDRFIYGVSTGQDPGATGGANSHSHTIIDYTTTQNNTEIDFANPMSGLLAARSAQVPWWFSAAAVASPGNSIYSGSQFSFGGADGRDWITSNAQSLPPYFKLAFIMKL